MVRTVHYNIWSFLFSYSSHVTDIPEMNADSYCGWTPEYTFSSLEGTAHWAIHTIPSITWLALPPKLTTCRVHRSTKPDKRRNSQYHGRALVRRSLHPRAIPHPHRKTSHTCMLFSLTRGFHTATETPVIREEGTLAAPPPWRAVTVGIGNGPAILSKFMVSSFKMSVFDKARLE